MCLCWVNAQSLWKEGLPQFCRMTTPWQVSHLVLEPSGSWFTLSSKPFWGLVSFHIFSAFCLSHVRISDNYHDWVTNQQTLISHSSGDWEVHDQGTRGTVFWQGSASHFTDSQLLAVSSHSRRVEGDSFIRNYSHLQGFYSGDLIQPKLPPEDPVSKWGLRFPPVNFGRAIISSRVLSQYTFASDGCKCLSNALLPLLRWLHASPAHDS